MTDDSNQDGEDTNGVSGGQYVCDALVEAGIDLLVGLPGTQTLPLDRVVADREDIRYVMARHETAIPHVAWGYYETCGRPAATLTVPGPGDTNAMHGLKNAYEDCVPIVHISADTDPADRGKRPIHEIEPDTFDNCVKANLTVERPFDLREQLQEGIARALEPPSGPVRLGIPSTILGSAIETSPVEVSVPSVSYDNADAYDRALRALASADSPVVYAGGGARRSADGPRIVGRLAETLDAPVAASYKGKGVFPEDDPRFLGVTGSHLPAGARRVLERADTVLALGTGFDGLATDDWSLPMGETLIHVDLDPTVFDRVYEADVRIVEDVGAAGETLLERLDGCGPGGWPGREIGTAVRTEYTDQLRAAGLLADTEPIRTPALLDAIRETLPREAVVTTDIGGFRLWSLQRFETHTIEQFVTAGSWAGMGIGLPAALGAKLARPDRTVVALTGDGGLLMCLQELHTAVQYGLDIVAVVSNNSDYGIISKSPKIRQFAGDQQFSWADLSFADIAEDFGWYGVEVGATERVTPALEGALEREGPVLIDADVETGEPSSVSAADYGSDIDSLLDSFQ